MAKKTNGSAGKKVTVNRMGTMAHARLNKRKLAGSKRKGTAATRRKSKSSGNEFGEYMPF